MAEKILVVEDELDMLQFLSRFLIRKGYAVDCATNGEEAWKAFNETVYDLVISDLDLGDISGMDLLERVRSTDNTLPFIIITGVGTIESAVQAIQQGAFHYLTKPFDLQEIEILTCRALEYGSLHRRLESMQHKEDEQNNLAPMIFGNSKSMVDIFRRVDKIADSSASVIIMGETGTGKSMLAKYIHMKSSVRDKPFFTIDCGALTETLLESELFGHVKGAFTGASRAKRGLLEEAQGGTILLDEICEISPQTQPKLLRSIQEKEVKPVGGNKPIDIDVRFISATSRDVKQMVADGLFREELYYRLAVVPVCLPPLRERAEDLNLFIDYFLKKFCQMYNREITQIKPDYLQALYSAKWKGNIRELANVMERSVLLADDGVLTYDCLCHESQIASKPPSSQPLKLKLAVEAAEKKAITASMQAANNNRSEAARLLGISRRALYDKLALYRLFL